MSWFKKNPELKARQQQAEIEALTEEIELEKRRKQAKADDPRNRIKKLKSERRNQKMDRINERLQPVRNTADRFVQSLKKLDKNQNKYGGTSRSIGPSWIRSSPMIGMGPAWLHPQKHQPKKKKKGNDIVIKITK